MIEAFLVEVESNAFVWKSGPLVGVRVLARYEGLRREHGDAVQRNGCSVPHTFAQFRAPFQDFDLPRQPLQTFEFPPQRNGFDIGHETTDVGVQVDLFVDKVVDGRAP